MNEDKPTVYDPAPMDMQIRAWDKISVEDLEASDLSSPQIVQILIHEQRVALTQLKASQIEVANLRGDSSKLKDEREYLRIQIATLESQVNATWLEIPISILSGFAINLLSSDAQNGLGWFLLILSVLMLVYLRGNQFIRYISQVRKAKDNRNA